MGSLIKTFLNNLSSNKLKFIFFLILSLLTAIFSVIMPLITGELIDILVYRQNELNKILLYLIVFKILSNILTYYSSKLYMKIQSDTAIEMEKKVFSHIQKISLSYSLNYDPIYITQLVNSATNGITIFILEFVSNIINVVLILISSLIFINSIDNKLFIIIGISILAYIFSYNLMRDKIREKIAGIQSLQSEHFSNLTSQINEIEYIKTQGISRLLSDKLNQSYKRLLNSNFDYLILSHIYSSLDMIIQTTGTIAIFLYAGDMIFKGKLTIGVLSVLLTYFNMLMGVVNYFFNFGQEYQNVDSYLEKLNEILKIPIERNGHIILSNVESITIDNLSFEYKENSMAVFNNFSYDFKKGNLYLLKGPNGIGKTSLINLILGMYIDEYSGTIKYNSIDIGDLDMLDMRSFNIGLVNQNARTLILDNLKDMIEFDENKKILFLKYIEIFKLNPNYDYFSEDKELYSGGELQKLMLIYALIKDSLLLILDEPISNFDSSSREIFIKEINKVKEDKIVIVITHDDSLDIIADHVLSLG